MRSQLKYRANTAYLSHISRQVFSVTHIGEKISLFPKFYVKVGRMLNEHNRKNYFQSY